MKKKLIGLVTLAGIMTGLTACSYAGYDLVDTNYHFDRAIIKSPDGEVIEGEVVKWADAEDGEQLTITIRTEEGTKRYMTNSSNVLLIEED